MKKLLLLPLLLVVSSSFAQTYIKFNAPLTLLGAPQIGVETSLGKKVTFEGDVLGTYWESFNNAPLKMVMVFAEVRYHFNEKYNGIYVGGNIGGSVFQFQKWNYLNSNKYQTGESVFMGVSLGYEIKINDKWMIDMFIGGGNQQSHYVGRYLGTDERYEHAGYNKSGEWLPYRGGIMFSYKL